VGRYGRREYGSHVTFIDEARAAFRSGETKLVARLAQQERTEEAIAMHESLGDGRMLAAEQHNLAHLELNAGNIGRARTCRGVG
jgi:hypothetical protein